MIIANQESVYLSVLEIVCTRSIQNDQKGPFVKFIHLLGNGIVMKTMDTGYEDNHPDYQKIDIYKLKKEKDRNYNKREIIIE